MTCDIAGKRSIPIKYDLFSPWAIQKCGIIWGDKAPLWDMLVGVILNTKNDDRHLRRVAIQNGGKFQDGGLALW